MIDPTTPAVTFGAAFAALYVAHSVADHWLQTTGQALAKGGVGWPARLADARHVASLTLAQLAALTLAAVTLGIHFRPAAVAVGLAVNAITHYWADRRSTLAGLAELLGRGEFYSFGAPRAGHDDAPSLGTGAYALDQSWHHGWIFVAALLIAAL
jgi:hypothetical protein